MKRIFIIFGAILLFWPSSFAQTKTFTDKFDTDSCVFASTGRNRYFKLEPGFQLILQDSNGGRLVITVLNETKRINNVETRVVEENESENGKTVEISRNFFAVCKNTNSIFYFGEDVDIYSNGTITGHEGSWIAEGKNRAGIAMPGIALVGSRYFQEIAPGVAMDRAEIVSIDETIKTPAGTFTDCLKTEESNALKPKEREFKYYAPGIGLIRDEDMVLISYGFVKN